MDIILDSKRIEEVLRDFSERISEEIKDAADLVIIGVRSRGEVLSQRLGAYLSEHLGKEVPVGTLDITLYRDDLNQPQSLEQPQVRTTEIGFDIDGKIIILVDDVLNTGRSARAAMDALIDLGRPRAIKLAVLVDRGEREFPICANYIGVHCEVEQGSTVQVRLTESDGRDEVVIE